MIIQELNTINESKEIINEIISHRRHIHKNPELSFQEYNTAKYIRDNLDKLGIKWKAYAETGTAAIIGEGIRTVGLRADIDALPIQEETGLEFSSDNDGVMHACGHDMHTSMLLGAAKILKQNEDKLKGKILLIFQLGEEQLPGGATLMIKDGLLEDFNPEVIFGQHIYPGDEVGYVAVNDGPVMGAADELYLEIIGDSTHAAQPHLGNDPIVAASQLIIYLQTLIPKYKDPTEAGVITIGSINGGFANNIIPDKVSLKGTMRAFNNSWRENMHSILEERLPKIAEAYGCSLKLTIKKGYPPLINDRKASDFVKNNMLNLFGDEKTLEFEPKMWGEDFAYYAQSVPSCFWFVGVRSRDKKSMPALHNSKLNPEEEAMIYGTALLVENAIKWLEKTDY